MFETHGGHHSSEGGSGGSGGGGGHHAVLLDTMESGEAHGGGGGGPGVTSDGTWARHSSTSQPPARAGSTGTTGLQYDDGEGADFEQHL